MLQRSPIVDLFDDVASTSAVPERRLMAAVLFDAVLQLARRGSKGATEVVRWIRDSDSEDTPFSFAAVCEGLGLDAEYLRRGLLAWDPLNMGEGVRLPSRRALAVQRRPRVALHARRPRRPSAAAG